MTFGIFFAFAIPLGLILAATLVLVGRWTDRKGWTRFRGSGRRAVSIALDGWNPSDRAARIAAVEYRKAAHDEEEQNGKRLPPEDRT